MTVVVGPADIERFRSVVARRLGLQITDDKLDQLADVLHHRLDRSGCRHVMAYLARLDGLATWPEEERALAQQLTVGETYFFRNPDHFRALAEHVLPERLQVRRTSRTLRVLSAGCASGEEAYSVATVIADRLDELAGWEIEIVGIDINPAVIEKAARGHYSEWSLRETPADQRARYFRADGREFVFDERVRGLVRFEERNLLHDDADFWWPHAFDIVFCRNVIMYFSPEVARTVVARIARAHAPGGFLFLGHAEVLRGISEDFHLRHTHETFYYQRPATGEVIDRVRSLPVPRPAPRLAASWMEDIERASARIATLVRDCNGGAGVTPVEPSSPAAAPARVLETAMDLVRKERFQEALEFLRLHPGACRTDRDEQLLQACLLANVGEFEEAETACRRLLGEDELNAGAHYLMALCREHAGDRLAAVAHDETAIYLDAAFTMPHLHLGLLAKRVGDVDLARRELGQVLDLLPNEDPVRLLLFGGGFGRDALSAFCRSELRACAGAA